MSVSTLGSTPARPGCHMPPAWCGGEVPPERVGLYRRFVLAAARRGWRLGPHDVATLLDIYLAYTRRLAVPSVDTCLRVFRRLQQRRA